MELWYRVRNLESRQFGSFSSSPKTRSCQRGTVSEHRLVACVPSRFVTCLTCVNTTAKLPVASAAWGFQQECNSAESTDQEEVYVPLPSLPSLEQREYL